MAQRADKSKHTAVQTPNQAVIVNPSFELTREELAALAQLTGGEPGDSQKAYEAIAAAAKNLANGGLLLTPEEMDRIEQATGIDPATGEDLLPFLSAGAGMEEGSAIVRAKIDPAYLPAYEEIAKGQERSVEELFQDVLDQILENEWVYECHPRPVSLLMSADTRSELEEVLGEPFQNGTELAALVKKALGFGEIFAPGVAMATSGEEE